MKHLPVVLALALFLALALAFYFERPESADDALFGAEMALAPELAPLELERGTLELRGRVRASDGSAAVEAFFALLPGEDDLDVSEPRSTPPLYHGYTDEQGRFALAGLAPGTYRVLLTHPSAPPRTFALELPAAGEQDWELAAPLPPLPALPEIERGAFAGRVRLPEALASAEAPALQGFEVLLRPAPDTALLAGATERRATTGADGSFEFDQLVLARYEVEVLPPWARGGSWPVLARGTSEVGANRAAFELTLDVGALAGELNEAEGRPLAGALVRVGALEARDAVGEPQLWPPVVTDPGGRFRVELLPAGRYLVHLRAGSAARDVEVVVERGRVTSVPLGAMDPRAPVGTAGG